ncbi:hypothetical protein C1T31_07650 [Hanstruepera neustonica]|uniref:Lacal_2735 family protein n=1 Tax=Hanstruepera neustonica TaxID=1445657 RepID=A0A2K1DZD6_9FLAO|nr:Lacal_2735 family protein [Hanstruepera neustonica]PNQ73381.1 hypothetical protein C1T31_07650 [Hanstruepera neustonica]
MKSLSEITNHRKRLQKRYKQLMENAYNLRQTDSAESDISEYQAIKLLDELNRLNYLHRDFTQSLT